MNQLFRTGLGYCVGNIFQNGKNSSEECTILPRFGSPNGFLFIFAIRLKSTTIFAVLIFMSASCYCYDSAY